MAGLSPPAHEDIVWPLHFRFSIAATLGKGTPWWMWALIGTGSVLMLAGPVLLALVSWPSSLPARFRPKQNLVLGVGVAALVAGCALALPPISVPAFPSTYLTTDIPYDATSIAAGLNHFEQNCTGCHGVSGHGDGPAASSLPIKPADLSAPHTALHTPGDLYWWITHGILASGMPPFGDVLTNDDRWDIINFLGAFAVGYQARVIEPKIQPGQYWLGPPDFQVTDEDGKTHLLSDYQRKSALLVALFSCTQENVAQETARLEQLLAARERLAALGAKIILVAPGKICGPLRALATGKTLNADHGTEDIAATYGLFIRVSRHKPNPHAAWDRDHLRPKTSSTRPSASASTLASTRTRLPSPRSISIMPAFRPADRTGGSGVCTKGAGNTLDCKGGDAASWTGIRRATAGIASPSTLASFRQAKISPRETPCLRATSETFAPGVKLSPMIRAFSSSDQRRRRSTPLKISAGTGSTRS